jgi:hypothetical protein
MPDRGCVRLPICSPRGNWSYFRSSRRSIAAIIFAQSGGFNAPPFTTIFPSRYHRRRALSKQPRDRRSIIYGDGPCGPIMQEKLRQY